jgi:hypothetical protein
MHGKIWKTLIFVGSLGATLAFAQTQSFAQQAQSRLTRNPDGSVRISVVVTGPGVQDVHLCVARTKDSATEHTTMNGDAVGRNWSNPAGAAGSGVPALPPGWGHQYMQVPDPAKPTESNWCHVWNNPAAALPGAGHTFVVDYSGGKDVKASKAPNVMLTKNGRPAYAAADVINGEGAAGSKKGEKGFMPVAVYPARLSLIPRDDRI